MNIGSGIGLLLFMVVLVSPQAVAKKLPDRPGISASGPAADASQGTAFYEQAYDAYQAEEWKQAERLIEQAIAADPQRPAYHKLKAYILVHGNDDHAGALRAVDASLALDDRDGEAYGMRATSHYFLGDRQEAVTNYSRAFALDYRNSNFYKNYLHVLNELRRYDEMIAVHDAFQRRHREDPHKLPLKSDIPFYASLAYYARQDYVRTIELLTEAIALSPDSHKYYGNRASAYADMKQYTLALADYASALRLAPKDADHYYNRGVAWLAMKDYRRALDDFSSARTMDRDDTNLWLNLGVAYRSLEQNQEALSAYNRALELDPENALARANRATLLQELGNIEAAQRDHERALASLPEVNAATLRYNDAQTRMEAQDWAGAVSLLQEAVRLRPDFEEAWVNLGVAQARLGERQAALDIFNDVLKRFPDSTKALVNRAKLLDGMGDSEAARSDYQRALELEPTNSDYMEHLAKHHARSGNRRDAQTYFERARLIAASPDVYINYTAFLLEGGDDRQALVVAREGARKFPTSYWLLINLGNAQSEAGAWEESIAAYRSAIALQPDRWNAYYNLGNLYAIDMRQPARGIEWYRRALSQQPDSDLDPAKQRDQRATIRLNLASALADTGERASALAVLQEAIDHDPENYRPYFNRAGLALEAGDESSAKRDFAAAAERMQAAPGSLDDDPERLEYLGYALFHLGRNEEAVVKLERLLQQHPDNHSARRNLGYILLELDRPADAQRQFEQAFPAEPDEIDGWLGLLVCVALTEYPGRLADLKSQFDKRFAPRHALDDGLPQRLQGQGYWYSPRFKQLWTKTMASR